MHPIAAALLGQYPAVRYVAVYHRGKLQIAERDGLVGASAPESDRYEELLVNPTLLTLTHQRGTIDCGGLEYLLVRYGNFFQLVHPITQGHVSVAIDTGANPFDLLDPIRNVCHRAGVL